MEQWETGLRLTAGVVSLKSFTERLRDRHYQDDRPSHSTPAAIGGYFDGLPWRVQREGRVWLVPQEDGRIEVHRLATLDPPAPGEHIGVVLSEAETVALNVQKRVGGVMCREDEIAATLQFHPDLMQLLSDEDRLLCGVVVQRVRSEIRSLVHHLKRTGGPPSINGAIEELLTLRARLAEAQARQWALHEPDYRRRQEEMWARWEWEESPEGQAALAAEQERREAIWRAGGVVIERR